MRKCLTPVCSVVLVATLGAGLAGCGQVGKLKGKLAFREANDLYKSENYAQAIKSYEEALAQGCTADGACDPEELQYSYFFMGNSYENMFRPTKRGDATNDGYLQKAIENYQIAAERSPDPEYRKRSLQYMAVVYGAEKLNEPEKAQPIIQKLIDLDPKDVGNYYQMARIYEDAGDFEQAEAQMLKAREARPDFGEVYGQIAAYYERRGEFEKQIEALQMRAEKEPTSPEAQYTIANVYWTKACLPSRPQCKPIEAAPALKPKYIQAGLVAADKALALRGDYIDALVFKNLLLRSQAYVEPNRAKELVAQAEEIMQKVREIQAKQKGGQAE
jgi:tetratricopeptide (TPR) repeat protein